MKIISSIVGAEHNKINIIDAPDLTRKRHYYRVHPAGRVQVCSVSGGDVLETYWKAGRCVSVS